MNVRERKPRQKKEIVGEFLAELLTGIINSHFNTSTESTFPNVVKSLNNTSCQRQYRQTRFHKLQTCKCIEHFFENIRFVSI